MDISFPDSHLKVERAKKHIVEISALLTSFVDTDFDRPTLEHDSDTWEYFPTGVFLNTSLFPVKDVALAMGDVLHNLRSALDHVWFKTMQACGGKSSNYTTFPIFDSREDFIRTINTTLKKKQITRPVATLVLDSIKPYQAGSPLLWGLHRLNISDKHEVLIPVLQLVSFRGVHLQEGDKQITGTETYIMGETATPIRELSKIKNKGQSSASVLFAVGTPFEGEPVIPTLYRIAEEVTRTIKTFELL